DLALELVRAPLEPRVARLHRAIAVEMEAPVEVEARLREPAALPARARVADVHGSGRPEADEVPPLARAAQALEHLGALGQTPGARPLARRDLVGVQQPGILRQRGALLAQRPHELAEPRAIDLEVAGQRQRAGGVTASFGEVEREHALRDRPCL